MDRPGTEVCEVKKEGGGNSGSEVDRAPFPHQKWASEHGMPKWWPFSPLQIHFMFCCSFSNPLLAVHFRPFPQILYIASIPPLHHPLN